MKGIFQLRALKQDYSAVHHISHYTNDNAPAPNGGDDDDDDDNIVDSISNNNNNAKLYYLHCALFGGACV